MVPYLELPDDILSTFILMLKIGGWEGGREILPYPTKK